MNLLVRADGGERMGMGHVMRTLALAQAWQDAGGSARYALAAPQPAIAARLRAEAVEIDATETPPGSPDDARRTVELAQRHNAACVVVDGYQFGGDYQRGIKESGVPLLVLDDYGHADHYWADWVLNQNLHAHERLYRSREPYAQLLLGVRYAMLRREFLAWRGWQRTIPDVASKVLISVGGGDPDNLTLRMMEALDRTENSGTEAVVVAGAANNHYADVQAAAKKSRVNIRVERNAADMPSLMAWADVALGAAGSTSWERAFMGLPSLVVVVAANQEPLARELAAAGVVGDLRDGSRSDATAWAKRLGSLMQSQAERRGMSETGRRMIDGDGARRVLMRLRGEKLRLRPATPDDCELLWRWANQPEVRARSFCSEPIPWETHVAWFEKNLHDPDCHIFIGFNCDDAPVGQVRFNACRSDCVEVGVSVCDKYRGQGFGTPLLQAAVVELFKTTSTSAIHALIKPENRVSVRMFEKAGFQPAGTSEVANIPALKYVCRRGDVHAR